VAIQVERTGISVRRLLKLYGISSSTFYGWSDGFSPTERFNPAKIRAKEEAAVLDFRKKNRDIGYRKFSWLMNDNNIAYLSESAVYKVLAKHNLLGRFSSCKDSASKEYKNKPKHVHHHWHADIAYIKINGIFYFLIMILDGYSRYILDWELMPDMLGSSVEAVVQRAKQKYPKAKPMLITDNGCQFISLDFKRLLSNLEIQHVRTRRNHPQTNGKIERLNGTVKQEAIRTKHPTSFLDAVAFLENYVDKYNNHRLYAGIHFLRPADILNKKALTTLKLRRRNLKKARILRIKENLADVAALDSHTSQVHALSGFGKA
jgi:putative transposase